ncbi:polysaccharide pyruvyl transferase family protein [Metabacillus halosaccharovorans]|uniref:polysaccharide pyruvyl transferase family protein n=1 Tax=Metabacillus halosaccharovorans TaxID=930124 RepID=UPI003735F3D7
MKKKILVNAYFAMNFGDDLFLKILFDRYPNVEWHLLTTSENMRKTFKDYKNVKILKSLNVNLGIRKVNVFYKMNEILFNYKKYDAFVYIGGSIFMELPYWRESLNIRGYIPKKFKMLNKRTFIIGANFGPFKDESYIETHREFFANFDDICFRDSYSYNLFRDLDNIRVAPDVVFNLKIDKTKNIANDKSVGFSLIDLENRKGLKNYSTIYKEKIIKIIEKYIEDGYTIKLFSFCEQEGDLRIINDIYEEIRASKRKYIKIITYRFDIEGFLNEFKSCEVIIGIRFHSIILALLFNQKFLPIIYSEKTLNVLRDLNMGDIYCYISDIHHLDVDNLVINNKTLKKKVSLEAEKQFHKLDFYLNNDKGNNSHELVSEGV